MLAQQQLVHNFKPKIKAKTIHKIVLDDDVLKIEYRNQYGSYDDLIFTDPRHPDLNDLESFVVSLVQGLKQDHFDQDFLSRFGKSIYHQLQIIIDPNNTGFGRLNNISFGRFIIERAFESTVRLIGSQKDCLRREVKKTLLLKAKGLAGSVSG